MTESMNPRTIQKVIHAIKKPEGVGAVVRRSIGVPGMYKFSPFLMLDHFYVPEGGFEAHPHSSINTVTLVKKGAIMHEDFNNKGVLFEGDMQIMSSRSGIVHAEMPVALKSGQIPEGMQLWVDQPIELRKGEPSYTDVRGYEIEEAEEQDGKLKVSVLSGEAYGIKADRKLLDVPFHYYTYNLKPGAIFEQKFPEDFNVFLYVMKGDGLKISDGTEVNEFHSAFFKTDGSSVKGANPISNDDDIEFLLVGGKILDQPTVHYGPFVADSQAQLREIIEDYSYQRNAFAPMRNWQSLISNGVTQDMVDKYGGSESERDKKRNEYLAKKRELVTDEFKDEL